MTDSKRLRVFMTQEGLSQQQFAQLVRVSAAAVSQWLSNSRKVPGPVWAYIDLYRAHSIKKKIEDTKRHPSEMSDRELVGALMGKEYGDAFADVYGEA